jgi:hypothetical protein
MSSVIRRLPKSVAHSPIRAHVGADGAALRAHHSRPERWHGEIACEMVDIHDHLASASVIGSIGSLKRERAREVSASAAYESCA